MGGINQSISPGIGGFITFFLLACALWLLMRSMLRHMHTVDFTEEREEAGEGRVDSVEGERPVGARADRRDAPVDAVSDAPAATSADPRTH